MKVSHRSEVNKSQQRDDGGSRRGRPVGMPGVQGGKDGQDRRVSTGDNKGGRGGQQTATEDGLIVKDVRSCGVKKREG